MFDELEELDEFDDVQTVSISVQNNKGTFPGDTVHEALTDAIIFALDPKSINNKSEAFLDFCYQIEETLRVWEKQLKILKDFE